MSAKIKFSFIKMFFRLFSFLADKTGGWKIFVQPKLMLGTMILGLGVAACNSAGKAKNETAKLPDTTQTEDVTIVKCYEGNITDSTLLQDIPPPEVTYTTCYFQEILISCYDISTDTIIIEQTDTITIEANDTTIYDIVDKKPEFPGGYDALKKFIDENLLWPAVCAEMAFQGKVYCKFVVEKDGEISDIKILKGLRKLFDDEAIRVISIMPKWIPAEKNNKIVRCYFTLPVSFKS